MSTEPDRRCVHSAEVPEWWAVPAGSQETGPRLIDFLLPTTDEGVYAQAIGALVLFGIALWFARRNKDLVWFVAGLGTLTAGLMGLRALH